MAVFKSPCNQITSDSAEKWTENKDLNVELVERIGFVPLEKRLRNIERASSLLQLYREAQYADADVMVDERGNMSDDFDDDRDFDSEIDPTSSSDFDMIDAKKMTDYLSKKPVRTSKPEKKVKEVPPEKIEKEVKEDE